MIKRKLSEMPKSMRDWVGAAHELSPTSKRLVEAWADFVEKESADLESQLATANKKAEKLVEVLLPFMGRLEGWRKMLEDKTIVEPISAEWLAVEQAIKEFRGGDLNC